MSPPLIHLSADQIKEKALTFNECLRKSRKTTGYHTFTLLFRIEFERLSKSTQSDLLVEHLGRDHGSSSSPFVAVRITRKNIRKVANKHWDRLSGEVKQAWRDRATARNNRPCNDGFFTDIPFALSADQYISNPVKDHIMKSISEEWVSFHSHLRNAILRQPRKQQSTVAETSYKFGNETFLLLNQIYRTFHLTHLLKVVLFGSNSFDRLKAHEVVERTKNQIIVHIASYERMQTLFTMNGLNGACHFVNEDEYDVVWGAAGKVWLRETDRSGECIGYVLKESNDELEVMLDGDDSENTVFLRRPSYDARNGRYVFVSDASLSNYQILQYAPVRMKLITSSNKMHIVLNRIEMTYSYSNEDLNDNSIVIASQHVLSINTPLDS